MSEFHTTDKAASGVPDFKARLLAIVRGNAHCPRCGALRGEPCLTWRGETFLDGHIHSERDPTAWHLSPDGSHEVSTGGGN